MKILPFRIKREIGYRYTNLLPTKLDGYSSLIESLRCRVIDEHVIVGEEDGSLVPPIACSFCKVPSAAHVLGLCDENGYVSLYDTNISGHGSMIKDWLAHSNAVFDLAWLEKEEKLLTASGDQSVALWDAKTATQLELFKGHTSSVRSVSLQRNNDAVFATGSRDGHIMLWDRRCNKKDNHITSVNTIKNAHSVPCQVIVKQRKKSKLGPAMDSQQSVTVVNFQTDNLLVSAGAVDGCIKVWDLRRNYSIMTTDPQPVHSFPYTGPSKRLGLGYSSLVFDSTLSRLFANCTDDIIYLYDFAAYTKKPLSMYRGHRNSTFYVKAAVSPDDQFLLSGSSDELAYIWQIDKPNRSPVVLKGHRSEVTDVAWSKQGFFKLVTLSDDNMMRVWRHDPTLKDAAIVEGDRSVAVSGIAERKHREIGTSARSTPDKTRPVEVSYVCTSPPVASSSETQVSKCPTTPVQSKMLSNLTKKLKTPQGLKLKKPANDCSPKLVSPSIKSWLTSGRVFGDSGNNENKRPVASHSCSNTGNSSLDKAESSKTEGVEQNNNTVGLKISVCSNDNKEQFSQKKKTSCKRKLVEDEDADDNPRKRPNVLKDMESVINSSPEKNERLEVASPLRVTRFNLDNEPKFSPTSNLPNSVFDSVNKMPHCRKQLNKENEGKKSRIDWLTQIRLKKKKESGNISDKDSADNTVVGKQGSVSSQTGDDGSQNSKGSISESPLGKSPIAGVKSITDFFPRKNTTKVAERKD